MSDLKLLLVQVLFSLVELLQGAHGSCPKIEKRGISSDHEASITSRFDSQQCLLVTLITADISQI